MVWQRESTQEIEEGQADQAVPCDFVKISKTEMKLTNFFVVKMRCKNILFVKKKWKTSEYMDPPIKVLHMAKLQTTRFV